MSRPEQLRTFIAVFRARSVTDGAHERRLSQPAASQQLAALEKAVGSPLFVRTPHGVEPTGTAVALYAETASAVDQLEVVLTGLDDAPAGASSAPLRLGSTAEVFSSLILPRIGATDLAVLASFDDDVALLRQLERGELDVAVMSVVPGRRSFDAVPIGEKRFVLVGSPRLVPDSPSTRCPLSGTGSSASRGRRTAWSCRSPGGTGRRICVGPSRPGCGWWHLTSGPSPAPSSGGSAAASSPGSFVRAPSRSRESSRCTPSPT